MALLAALAGTSVALAQAPAEAPSPQALELHAELQNLFLLRSDSDFDATPPAYDASGQTEGAFATVFRPSVTWRPFGHLRLHYEAEVGLNYWSKNNPDEQDALASDVFVMKHREVYAEGELAERWAFKAGYQRLVDPTGLFVHHWIGAAQVGYAWSEASRGRLFVGQIPDQVYEGILVTQNNFRRDVFVYGGDAELSPGGDTRVLVGLFNLVDSHIVGQTRWVLSPVLHVEGRVGGMLGAVDAALQVGQFNGLALGGGNQTAVAGAVQAHGALRWGPTEIDLNLLALSPDDGYDGNDWNHAFLYSGKSRSATVMLTEDEIRDWYDNYDERISAWRDGFFLNRAGLVVADVKATWPISEAVRPSLVVGGATALNPRNALGQAFVGFEADAVVEVRLSDHLVLKVLGGVLFPGLAGAALVNQVDRRQMNPVYMAEASLMVRG